MAGTGAENNDAINVQTGSVTGTSAGFAVGDGNTFTLSSGTTVTGGANGIAETGNGTATLNNNGGTVSGNGANAVVNGFVSPGSLTGTNSGTISAVTTAVGGSAIAVNPSTSVVNFTNANGATISATGNGGEAVGVQSNTVTLNNVGTIMVTGGTGSGSFGVFGLNAVNVTNSGKISADDVGGSFESIAIVSNGTVNVTNNGGVIQATGFSGVGVLGSNTTTVQNNGGTISGTLDGVNTNTAATTAVTNSGMIAGTARDGIRVNTASVTNNAGGTVTGATGIFFRAGNGASTVFDAGTITGTGGTAIQFSTGSVGNTLTLAPSFVVNGNVVGAGSDIFQLGGSGTGAFNLSTIGAASQYQGFTTFNVLSGTWVVSGTFSQTQAWNVNGGVLAGTGTLASVNVNNGGTLAPGMPGTPGTSMTINGNLAFQSGALYMVQVNATSTTFANVTGTAALAGGVSAAITASTLKNQYVILQSGGLGGSTFASLTTTGLPAGFTATLSYNANDVFLNFSTMMSQQTGLNQNQQNVANALANFFNNGGTLPPISCRSSD
jgi:hypothetical protein